ncbi:polysaccharide deacetylase family protein [Marinimicrobium agarilyticum]|uniref:polysaccharide deacetylase family protein n=1 Tax=Marinimicrobium agarilyticum TaxID=306546 RepID=UPI00040E9059|nr:polysaccharide deacetylase family protein [Marinimicrobium agarilyticum]
MYHRILPESDPRYHQEEPGMRVTPESFEMHLRELKRHFELVSLGDWVKAQESGAVLPRQACAVTFDDGWRDNFEYALPLLKKHQVPATLFAVAEKIGTDFQFWPNVVAALMLSGAGPTLAKHPVLGVAGMVAVKPTPEQVAACIKQLKAYTDLELFQALEELKWRELLSEPMKPALMDWPQLREMQASGLVEIGSHTCTHQRLNRALPESELEREIVESRSRLERELEHPINLFCFPNGDYSAEALSLVKRYYKAAVTTQKGINDAADCSLHEMVRIGIHNDITSTPQRFNARLSGWV